MGFSAWVSLDFLISSRPLEMVGLLIFVTFKLDSFSPIATPFANGLAQQGVLQYPMFGISITKDNGGSFALGKARALVTKHERHADHLF